MLIPQSNLTTARAAKISTNGVRVNRTYKMNVDDERVMGIIDDDLEAVEQAVYKILNTERRKHVIYSWNYGVELADLFGKPIPYVLPEIPRRITEALLMDDRINDVTDFDVDHDGMGNVFAKFIVVTKYGDLQFKKEVNIGV